MAKKTGYIHLHVSGSIQILSKSQYQIDINNAGITSKVPLTGSIEKLGNKTISFQYEDTKISIGDMLITYQVVAGSNTKLVLAQGVLKATDKKSIDLLSRDFNSIYVKSTKAMTQSNKEMERQIRIAACNHADGAIQVAQYIVNEIQTNVNSPVAHRMRYHLTGEISNQLERIFNKADASITQISKQTGHPIAGANHRSRSKITAAELWIGKVNTNKPWDHKNKIREKFKHVAVYRPLPPPKSTWSETWYHKYRGHDYFLDIWSNIHYGYVGRSVGFTKDQLMMGSGIQQVTKDTKDTIIKLLKFHFRDAFKGSGDTIDDETGMLIGIELFEAYSLSRDITATKILNQITSKPDDSFPNSKVKHYCFR